MTMLSTTPRFAPGAPTFRRTLLTFLTRVGRLINHLIAAEIARCERQATRAVLSHLGDRELKDIGIRRSEIGDAMTATAEPRMRMQQSQRV